jgi:dTDP-4-dehydrorhamnose 3,5-epimerase
MIEGVEIKDLVTHQDERGFFREIIRATDHCFAEGFGQLSHSLMFTGVAKAWHLHNSQVDWWYVPVGDIRVALYDTRSHSATYREIMELLLGEHQQSRVLRIPPGVAHGCKCLNGPSHLFYVTSRVYDPADEQRIAYNDSSIGYDWEKGQIIK